MTKKKSTKKKEAKQEAHPEEKIQLDQNKYIQMQMIDQQIKQVQQYLQTFDQQLVEIRNVIASLKDLEKLKKGDQILAPLASGIFVKAKLEENKEVRVNVGSGTVVTQSISQAVEMLQGQEAEITQYRSDTMAKFDELVKKAEELQG